MHEPGRIGWFEPATGLTPNRARRRRVLRAVALAVVLVMVGLLAYTGVPLMAAGLRPTESPPAQAVGPAPSVAVVQVVEPPVATPPAPAAAGHWQASSPWLKPIDGLLAPKPPAMVLGPPARLVSHVKTARKVVALTFDDGWSPAAGRLILATLLKEHIPATFFVNSMYVSWSVALWKNIAAAGFPIGNHTYDHANLTTLSYGAMVYDIKRDANVFKQLTGYDLAPLFRPPYGDRNRTVDAAVRAAGYPTEVLWNVVSGDTLGGVSDANQLAAASAGGPGSIVLMHMGPASTPRILAAVIARYRARGYAFVTIPQLIALGH